jgi:hypothetical protein
MTVVYRLLNYVLYLTNIGLPTYVYRYYLPSGSDILLVFRIAIFNRTL